MAVAAQATPGTLWCSASQTRSKPAASAVWAVATVRSSAWETVPPSMTAARSRSESLTVSLDYARAASSPIA